MLKVVTRSALTLHDTIGSASQQIFQMHSKVDTIGDLVPTAGNAFPNTKAGEYTP